MSKKQKNIKLIINFILLLWSVISLFTAFCWFIAYNAHEKWKTEGVEWKIEATGISLNIASVGFVLLILTWIFIIIYRKRFSAMFSGSDNSSQKKPEAQ